MANKVTNIAPFEYIHVLNKNTNTTSLVCGPQNFAIQDNEKIVSNVCEKMIIIPNLHYVIITNPVLRNEEGNVVSKNGGTAYRFQNSEVRTREKFPNPFPLYPNERLTLGPSPLEFVNANEALHLKAALPFKDLEQSRIPGDEWLFYGPAFYVPCQEVTIVRKIESIVIEKNQALRIKATKNCIDCNGINRVGGQHWLVRTEGSYLLNVSEEFVSLIKADILDDNTALHLYAEYDFTDIYNIERKAGSEWIVTYSTSSLHILDVYERKIGIENRVILGENDYCVIVNPFNQTTNKNDLGKMVLVKGESSFFLNPGEKIQGKIEQVSVLTESEALLVQAKESFENRKAGEKWMIQGPVRFIPPIEVSIIEKRNLIPLDKNEGIYVRNVKTGVVKTVVGKSYLLAPDENLWEKDLPDNIDKILCRDLNVKSRDKTRVVTFRCPFNSIMQIYNLKEKSSRIVFGPNLVMLEPFESFSVNVLSGSTPKKPGVVETLFLKLGPIFSTDEFDVETVDHTRLKLRIAYNWKFNLKKDDQVNGLKIFTIRDFIGDLCLTLGSKIRSFIATMTFDDFHKNSDRLIKKAVFGEMNEESKEINKFLTYENGLIVTDVDIQSVTPSDADTRKLLQQSVSLAIELATKTIKQQYQIQALMKRQEFKGELDRLKMNNKIEFLKKEIDLNKLKIESEITEKTGLSRAQAAAQKEAIIIEYTSKKKLAEMDKQAYEVEELFELKKQEKINDNEYLRTKEEQRVNVKKTLETQKLESFKFASIMESLGQETLVEISNAGPELQAKLLKGLNLEGYIITDGDNPINLFNVADSLVKKND